MTIDWNRINKSIAPYLPELVVPKEPNPLDKHRDDEERKRKAAEKRELRRERRKGRFTTGAS